MALCKDQMNFSTGLSGQVCPPQKVTARVGANWHLNYCSQEKKSVAKED